jgi:hypothetical protein
MLQVLKLSVERPGVKAKRSTNQASKARAKVAVTLSRDLQVLNFGFFLFCVVQSFMEWRP